MKMSMEWGGSLQMETLLLLLHLLLDLVYRLSCRKSLGIKIKKKTQVEKGRKSCVTAGIEKGPIKKMKQKGDATPECDVNSLYIF